MKRIQYLLLAIVAVVILSGDVVAQQPANNSTFGRGRLLRKWRNDMFGKTKQQQRPTAAKQGKQPTPAKQPSPAAASKTQRTGNQQNARNAAVRQSQARQQPTRSSKKSGFGMQVQADKKDNFMVTQVDSNGNAAAAGIRRGDLITQLGGTDLGSLDEFKEIVKVLGEGDQMELQISRRGQKKDVTVQYGEMPEIDETAEKTVEDANPASPVNAGTPVTGRYDFVPKDNSQFRSVLDGPISYRENQRIPARPSSGTRLNGRKR